MLFLFGADEALGTEIWSVCAIINGTVCPRDNKPFHFFIYFFFILFFYYFNEGNTRMIGEFPGLILLIQ